jgi:hypothetical protein
MLKSKYINKYIENTVLLKPVAEQTSTVITILLKLYVVQFPYPKEKLG